MLHTRIAVSVVLLSLIAAVPVAIGQGTGLCDFGVPPLTNQNLDFVASHYDSIVVGDALDITAIKAANPASVVYAYFNVMFTAVVDQNRYTEAMFMHDPVTGQRLLFADPDAGDQFFMDPASPAWRQFAVDFLAGEIARGFDGAHLDDVWGDWAHPLRPHPDAYAGIPPWYDAVTFRASVLGMLEFISAQLSPAPVIFNGYGPISLDPSVPFEELAYVPATAGLVLEGFVFDNRFGGGYVTPVQWPIIIDAFLAIPQGKTIGVISYGSQADTTARLFSLGSYLLGARDSSSFAYTPQCNVLTYVPELRLALGAPIETFATIDQGYVVQDKVYKRRFANGFVLVNPSVLPTGVITFATTLRSVVLQGGNVAELGGDGQMSFSAVSQITLGPGEAAVLLQGAGSCQCQ